jgi:hypothetical protein
MDAIVKTIIKVIEIFIDALFSGTTTAYIKMVIKVIGFLICTAMTIGLLVLPLGGDMPPFWSTVVMYVFALIPSALMFWVMYFSWLEKNR